MKTSDYLAQELQSAGLHKQIVDAARDGYFDELTSPLLQEPNLTQTPRQILVRELKEQGFAKLANRAKRGEFAPTDDEIEMHRKQIEESGK